MFTWFKGGKSVQEIVVGNVFLSYVRKCIFLCWILKVNQLHIGRFFLLHTVCTFVDYLVFQVDLLTHTHSHTHAHTTQHTSTKVIRQKFSSQRPPRHHKDNNRKPQIHHKKTLRLT